MKVAILYICTGKYSIFWNTFHKSCEKYFLPGISKKYFAFSDTLEISDDIKNVDIIYQQKLGWPNDTLMRFHLFSSISDKLKQFDYVFFFNANTNFIRLIDDSILLCDGRPTDLIVVKHPFFYWVVDPKDFPYERNRKSSAYVLPGKGKMYVMGGFNGGKVDSYLKFITTLKKRIDADGEKKIIAIWHDESHLNKYILESDENIKVLDYNFGFPQGHDLPLKNNIYIEFLDKTGFGGHDFLREKKNSVPSEHKMKKRFSLFRRIKGLVR